MFRGARRAVLAQSMAKSSYGIEIVLPNQNRDFLPTRNRDLRRISAWFGMVWYGLVLKDRDNLVNL